MIVNEIIKENKEIHTSDLILLRNSLSQPPSSKELDNREKNALFCEIKIISISSCIV